LEYLINWLFPKKPKIFLTDYVYGAVRIISSQTRCPYKGGISKTEAIKEIKRCAGTQFDPQLAEIFLKIIKT